MRQNVNYIEHQKTVYLKLSEDKRISAIHISLYMALFMIWNDCGFETELSINRNDVMKLSKIGSANTYTASLKELHELGYINYNPSFNPLKGSKVTIITFDKGSDKATNKGSDNGSGKGSDTLSKQLNLLNKENNKTNIAFAVFWDLYEKKKGNRGKCEIKWLKLKDEEREKIIQTLPDFKKSTPDIQFRPFPETYLNGKRWEDELVSAEKKTTYVAKQNNDW